MTAQRRWIEDDKKERKHRERSAKNYFIRLQVRTSMKQCRSSKKSGIPELMKAVD